MYAALLVVILPAADNSSIGYSPSCHYPLYFKWHIVRDTTNWLIVVPIADAVTTLLQCPWAGDEVPALMSVTCVSHSNQVKKGTLCKGLSFHCLITKWRLECFGEFHIFARGRLCSCDLLRVLSRKVYVMCFEFILRYESALKFVGVHGGTALQTGRSQFWFPMVSLEFFIDIILPAALCPRGWLIL